MVTSVVITTYNGCEHIIELLDSIRNQTRGIDEVLIYDDASSDNTAEIIRKYILRYDLEKWNLQINQRNLGWELNFKKGLLATHGDIIFPCDQDDIWHLNKIEKMSEAFETNQDIWLLASGYHAFSENGGKLVVQHRVLTENEEEVSKIPFNKHYYDAGRPGCTLAIKKCMLPMFEEIWKPGMAHDAVMWAVADLVEHLYLHKGTFIEYRRNSRNVSNEMYHGLKYKVADINRTLGVNSWYLKCGGIHEGIVKGCSQWCWYRYGLIVDKKLLNWFKLFTYRDYYLSTRKYLGDLYYYLLQVER